MSKNIANIQLLFFLKKKSIFIDIFLLSGKSLWDSGEEMFTLCFGIFSKVAVHKKKNILIGSSFINLGDRLDWFSIKFNFKAYGDAQKT